VQSLRRNGFSRLRGLPADMGANRQNVQRIVNDLHKEGLVSFEPIRTTGGANSLS